METYQPDYGYLAEKHMDTVYRVALCALRSGHDADDVTQNVMLRFFKYKPELDGEEHARRWLIRTTVNESKRLAVSFWRKRVLDIDNFKDSLQTESPEEVDVVEAVMSLPDKYRMTVHLHYFEGYKTSEIASMLGISVTAATTRLQRARELLRKKLDTDGGWKGVSC